VRVPFVVQAYRHRDLPIAAQRLINLFPQPQPMDAKARLVQLPTPGLRRFAALATAPVRGMIEMGPSLIVVSGSGVYRVSARGEAYTLGNIAEGGPVAMAQNGSQAAIVVPETRQAWIATRTTLAQITDADFAGAGSVAYVGGYFVFTVPDSDQFVISALKDGLAYDALDFATAEGGPDNLVAAARAGLGLWLFGERSIEVWSQTGAADFPFQREAGGFIDRGCAAAFSVAEHAGGPVWLGDDRRVWRVAGGAQPQPVSTKAIDMAIAGYAEVSDARGSVHEQDGQTFYALSFPGAGATWVCDLETGAWHARESEGYGGLWRCALARNYAGQVVGGDARTGQLYLVDPTAVDEDGVALVRTAVGTAFQAEARQVLFARLALEFTTGVGRQAGPGSDPVVLVAWSDDGGVTFGPAVEARLGRTGEYRARVELRRLGRSRQRVFRVQWSDPVRTALVAASIDAEAGAD